MKSATLVRAARLTPDAVRALARATIHTKNDHGVPYYCGYEPHVAHLIQAVQAEVLKKITATPLEVLSENRALELARKLMNTTNANGLPYFRGYESHVVDVMEAGQDAILEGRWPN